MAMFIVLLLSSRALKKHSPKPPDPAPYIPTPPKKDDEDTHCLSSILETEIKTVWRRHAREGRKEGGDPRVALPPHV